MRQSTLKAASIVLLACVLAGCASRPPAAESVPVPNGYLDGPGDDDQPVTIEI